SKIWLTSCSPDETVGSGSGCRSSAESFVIVSVNTTWFACDAPTAKSLGMYGSGAETVIATPSSQVIVSPNASGPASGSAPGASSPGASSPGASSPGSGSTGTSGIASSISSTTVPSDAMSDV